VRIADLAELPREPARAVVINVGTELVTTLALASAVAHAQMPVLVVNCDPTSESTAHLEHLGERWDFAVIDAPRRSHAGTLDRLFRDIAAELVLLLDSDAEIRDPRFVDRLRSSFDRPSVFGAGFVHGPMWLDEHTGVAPGTCLFQERAWMPCVMLRTSHVRGALDAGISFAPRTIYNDFMWSRKLSKALSARFRSPFVPRFRWIERLPEPVRSRFDRARFAWLEWARRDFFGHRPNYVVCDTGAEMFQWCKYQQGLVFAGTSSALRTTDEIVHYGGQTRSGLGLGTHVGSQVADVEADVIERLASIYAVDWDECVRHMTSAAANARGDDV
jgi:hypothetical protein